MGRSGSAAVVRPVFAAVVARPGSAAVVRPEFAAVVARPGSAAVVRFEFAAVVARPGSAAVVDLSLIHIYNRAPTFCRLRQQILSTLSICPDLPPCAQIRYFSNRIWLDTLKTMPISIIKNKTDVPP